MPWITNDDNLNTETANAWSYLNGSSVSNSMQLQHQSQFQQMIPENYQTFQAPQVLNPYQNLSSTSMNVSLFHQQNSCPIYNPDVDNVKPQVRPTALIHRFIRQQALLTINHLTFRFIIQMLTT